MDCSTGMMLKDNRRTIGEKMFNIIGNLCILINLLGTKFIIDSIKRMS